MLNLLQHCSISFYFICFLSLIIALFYYFYLFFLVLTGGHGRGLLLPLDGDCVGGGAAGLAAGLLHLLLHRCSLLLLPLAPEPDAGMLMGSPDVEAQN